jgi:uncharacterized membrane protein
MKQNDFFNILMDGLKDFPEAKLQDIISYYENKFMNGVISGITEEEIIKELGDPNLIVEKYRNENSNNYSNFDYTNYNISAGTFFEDKNPDIDNKYNYISSDFKASNNINDISDSKEIHTKLDNIKISDSPKKPNSNDSFYELYELNLSSDIQESNYASENINKKSSQYNVNNILRFCIIGLTLILFFPVITGIIGFIFGLFGVAISILVGSIGLLVGGTFTSFAGLPNIPAFVANFPYPVIVLFSLGSISLSIFLTLLFYYLCKFFIQISIKAYKSLKSKGGAF